MAIQQPDAASRMSMWDFGFGRFLINAPEGMCPWGEAKCDSECQPQSGCKLDRPREPTEITHGHHGAHQDFTTVFVDELEG